MNYQRRRRLYSQNFLHNPELISKLIRNTSIGKNDLIIEIGPGRGNITGELTKVAGKVIAVEIDEKLTLFLKNKFYSAKNLDIINDNFLSFNLPGFPYKVFANIPFNISADIVRKLTDDIKFSEGYLVVQREFAKKLIGKPYDNKNSMTSALLKPWFEISIYHKFSRRDFIPFPHVDSVMIHIKRLGIPLIPYFQKDIYRNFILYLYNREKVASVEFENIFKNFLRFVESTNEKQKEMVKLEARRIMEASKNIQKIHRTRKARNWRKF